jgi:hypothetical protein
MNKADKTIFKDFKAKPLSKGGILFFRLSVSHKETQAKRNKRLIFP